MRPNCTMIRGMSSASLEHLPLSRRVLGRIPAETLGDAVKLCNPAEPLDPEADDALRVELDAVRGGNRLRQVVRNVQRLGAAASSLQFVSGHIGAGKTTELRRLQADLLALPVDTRPTVLMLDATPLVETSDVDLEDLLVALWRRMLEEEIASAMPVLKELWTKDAKAFLASQATGAPEFLRGLLNKLPEVPKDGLSKLADALRFQPTEQRKALRQLLGSMSDVLIRGLNRALEKIRDSAAGPVVLIIDNLEKVSATRREVVEHLYLERLRALLELKAHVIITAPLFLVYSSAGGTFSANYGRGVTVLPMVRVSKRRAEGGGEDPAGVAAMAEVLSRRVDFDTLFVDGRQVAQRISALSGGSIRHALTMLEGAINEQDEPPITARSVDVGVRQLQEDRERAVPQAWMKTLAEIHRSNRFPAECSAETQREMLRGLVVLEYQNGEPAPYFDVHPLIVQSPRFPRE
jgi:hypothetical protein